MKTMKLWMRAWLLTQLRLLNMLPREVHLKLPRLYKGPQRPLQIRTKLMRNNKKEFSLLMRKMLVPLLRSKPRQAKSVISPWMTEVIMTLELLLKMDQQRVYLRLIKLVRRSKIASVSVNKMLNTLVLSFRLEKTVTQSQLEILVAVNRMKMLITYQVIYFFPI